MEQYQFHCDDCRHVWMSKDYPEDHDSYSGAECPKCKSENVGGVEIK